MHGLVAGLARTLYSLLPSAPGDTPCQNAFPSSSQRKKKPAEQNDRIVLEQILTQTYQASQVGKQLMGIGGETDIRRAGTIVVIQHAGLYGSLLHTEPASSAIDGIQYKLFRGYQDYEVPAGERYYVRTPRGRDFILTNSLSVRRPRSLRSLRASTPSACTPPDAATGRAK